MTIEELLFLLAVFMVAAIIIQPLLLKLRIPFAATLVAVGFAASEIAVRAGLQLNIDYESLHTIVIYLVLPILMFTATFRMESRIEASERPPWWPSLLLTIVTFFLVAAIIYYLMDREADFPWLIALLTASLLLPTDPMGMLRYRILKPVTPRIHALLQTEGLLNTGIGVTLFLVLSYVASHPEEVITLADIAIKLGWMLLGELILGLVGSLLAIYLSRRFQTAEQQALVAITVTYLAYTAAAVHLGMSGVIAALMIGYFYGRATRTDFSRSQEVFQERFWSFLDHSLGAVIYLLMGIAFTIDIFEKRWLAILFGIVAVLIARMMQLLAYEILFRTSSQISPLRREERFTAFTGGLRGALVLALALSIPVNIQSWWTIQSIAFGVVAFSLFLQAPVLLSITMHYDRLRKRAEHDTPG